MNNTTFNITLANDSNYYEDSASGISPLDISWQIFLGLLTIVPNALLLYILIFKIGEWTYSNFCFMSLTLCDFLVGALCLPFVILWLGVPNLNYIFGYFLVLVEYAQPQTGLYTLVFFSWHRLKMLVWPADSTEELTKGRILLVVGMWVVTYISWGIVIIIFVNIGYYNYEESDLDPPNYLIIVLDVVFYMLPLLLDCILIAVTIACLAIRAKKRPKIVAKSVTGVSSSRHPKSIVSHATAETSQATLSVVIAEPKMRSRFWKSKDSKAIACLTVLAINYLVSQIMYETFWPLYRYQIMTNMTAYSAAIWIGFSNSTFNPLIVFIFHEKVQAYLIKMFKFKISKS